MWSPRRIFFSTLGLLMFAAAYGFYSHFLGAFDGLPPLPSRFAERKVLDDSTPVMPKETRTDLRFQQAFGKNCEEVHWTIKLEMRAKGILIAANTFEIIKEGDKKGWAVMSPMSVATYGKGSLGPDGTPEISTMYADVGYLQFDKPVTGLGDMDNRKIVMAELRSDFDLPSNDRRKGRVRVINNRRTADRSDDLELLTVGPVFYMDDPKPDVPNGPRKPNVWTYESVEMTDRQNAPLPNMPENAPRVPTVTAVGMRIYLSNDTDSTKKKNPEVKAPVAKKGKDEKGGGASGVERIELDSQVLMNLWSDSKSGFVGPQTSRPKNGTPVVTPDLLIGGSMLQGYRLVKEQTTEKVLVQIKTNGPFYYDMTKDFAHFERPVMKTPGIVEYVTVTRKGRIDGFDVLNSDFLDIQFQRTKAAPDPKVPAKGPVAKSATPKDGEKSDGNMEIKTIHAWGDTVIVTSDSEKLYAIGLDLFHHSILKETILAGDDNHSMQAVKDGTLIRGRRMVLKNGEDKPGAEIAVVQGPGMVGMGERNPKTQEYAKLAYWNDQLIQTKEKELSKELDVLTFTGGAKFQDNTNGQWLQGRQLKLWLLPASEKSEKEKKSANQEKDVSKTSKPQRMEAREQVASNSVDLIIKRADYLMVWFKDVPELLKTAPKEEPKKNEPGKGPTPMQVVGKPKDPPPASVDPKNPAPLDPKGQPKKEEPKKEEGKPPIIMVAKRIETWINRAGSISELDHVNAEGDVDVHQDPTSENERGVDMRGRSLAMEKFKDGNHLVVTGTKEKFGEVHFDKLDLFGEEIVIDQRDNTAHVKGPGRMNILSSTDFEGKKLEKPQNMQIFWRHKMDFNGSEKLCFYHGRVQAMQADSNVLCEWMQVELDRVVYLNQDKKPKDNSPESKEAPKVDTVYCSREPRDETAPKPMKGQPVTVVEEVKEEGKLVRMQTILAHDVQAHNNPNPKDPNGHTIIASASPTAPVVPGIVRIFQPGQKDGPGLGAEPKKDPKPKVVAKRKPGELAPDEEMKLTVVQFNGKMNAYNKRRRAVFFDNIQVVHQPSTDPHLKVDIGGTDLPLGAIFLRCQRRLELYTTIQKERDVEGKEVEVSYQEMRAEVNAFVRKEGEFTADADVVKYSEQKGTLIFEGRPGNPAVVQRFRGQGIAPEELKGEVITYTMKTKSFFVEKGTGFSN